MPIDRLGGLAQSARTFWYGIGAFYPVLPVKPDRAFGPGLFVSRDRRESEMPTPPLPMNIRPLTGRRRLSIGVFGVVFGQVEIRDADGTRWVRANPDEWRWCQRLEDYENQKGIRNGKT